MSWIISQSWLGSSREERWELSMVPSVSHFPQTHFPFMLSHATIFYSNEWIAPEATVAQMEGSAANLNRHDIYFKEFYFSQRSPGPSYHTFAMQLSSGDRVYGHVRRYLPQHLVAKGRCDVGRRCFRSMVILTRVSGGEKFYHSLLKWVRFKK